MYNRSLKNHITVSVIQMLLFDWAIKIKIIKNPGFCITKRLIQGQGLSRQNTHTQQRTLN